MERIPGKRLTREQQKSRTRELLLESARLLFAKKGFEGTSIDEISENAGYSRGAFYANFSGKEEIMRELIRTGFDSDIEGILEMRKAGDRVSLAEGFDKAAREFYEYPDNLLWMLEFQLSVIRHPELRDPYTEQYVKLRQAIAGLLGEHLRESGLMKPASLEFYADTFMALLTGLSLRKVLEPERFGKDFFRKTAEIFMAGIQHAE